MCARCDAFLASVADAVSLRSLLDVSSELCASEARVRGEGWMRSESMLLAARDFKALLVRIKECGPLVRDQRDAGTPCDECLFGHPLR